MREGDEYMSELQEERKIQCWHHEMVGQMDGMLQTRMDPVKEWWELDCFGF